MPWDETDQYIRSGHREPGSTCRTITISADQGIKAIYCKYGDSWAIQSYLFAKDHGWNMSKAKSWFSSHKEQTPPTVDEAINMHADFKKILADFISFFKDKGREKFDAFIQAYRLNPAKSYSSQITRECLNGVCESFQWAKPFIKYLKSDESGKYYKVRALTATTSMNRNDYSDLEAIEKSARTLVNKRININHDHSRWLPFPTNRIVWAEFEDNGVESLIRIDNKQLDIQQKIENGEIVNPSIEALPIVGENKDGKYIPKLWGFTGLALLEKDITLPGVPTTFGIEPLFLNEGLRSWLVESLSVEKTNKEKNMTETNEAEWNPSADWPDSCYMHVPAEAKGADGKKSLRKLPYKYPSGEIDCPHVLAIIQVCQGGRGGVDLPDNLKAKYLAQAQGIYKRECNPDYEPSEDLGVEILRYDDEQHMKNKALDAIKEYFGINGLSICGQCEYFKMKEATTTKSPAATGDGVKTDAFNTLTVGNLGLGVGVCEVATKLKGREITVKHTDWACAEGRPRDTPAYGNRGTQNASFNENKKEENEITELEHKAEIAVKEKTIANLKEKMGEKDKDTDKERQKKLELQLEVSHLTEQLSTKDRQISNLEIQVTQLKSTRDELREKLDNEKNTSGALTLEKRNLDQDIKYYKTQADRYSAELQEAQKENSKLKHTLERVYTEKADESSKRASALQETEDTRAAYNRLQEEYALMSGKLADAQRKISDITDQHAKTARDNLNNSMENQKLREELRKKDDELKDNHRLVNDLKEQLRKRPKKIEVRV